MPRVKVPRELIVRFVEERQKVSGGISGEDIARFARLHGLSPDPFRRRVNRLLAKDPRFRHVRDRGKRAPRYDLDDYTSLCEMLEESPLTPPSVIVRNLNMARQARGLSSIPERTAYEVVQTYVIGLPADRKDPFTWFAHVHLPAAIDYDVSRARSSLDTHFSWSGLSTGYRVSLSRALERLKSAEPLFQNFYPGVAPCQWYERVLPRAPSLGAFLSSITTDRAPAIVARFAFESQVLWLTEAEDLVLDTLRLRRARYRTRLNARHTGKSNELLRDWKGRGKPLLESLRATPPPLSLDTVFRWYDESELCDDQARVLLRTDPATRQKYERLHRVFASLTRGFHPDEIQYHTDRSHLLLQLAREEVKWEEVSDESQACLGKNRRLLNLVDKTVEGELRRSILTERLLDSMARGKITISRSWKYQDLGRRMTGVKLPDDQRDWPLPPGRLELLLSCRYKVDLSPLEELRASSPPVDDEEEEGRYRHQIGYLDMAREVHDTILERHPDWFSLHRQRLEEAWQGSFRREYTEKEFTERFLLSVGFLGRSLRYREDPSFLSLPHFLKRYLTLETLETELSLYHDVLAKLTGKRLQALLADTIGREWKSTHPQSTWHFRYQMQGFSDFRAIGEVRIPAYSMVIASTETEAMHAVELVARARRVVGNSIRIYGGNSHTVSRVAAGLLWGVFDVVSAGHVVHSPPALSMTQRDRLRTCLPQLNKVFLLLRQRPELGRLFASRSHVYVDGVNVRPLVDFLGREVIWQWRELVMTGSKPNPISKVQTV